MRSMKLSLSFFKVMLTRLIKLSETIIYLQVIHFYVYHVYHQHIWLKGCSPVEQALDLSVTALMIIYFTSQQMLSKKLQGRPCSRFSGAFFKNICYLKVKTTPPIPRENNLPGFCFP